MSEGRRSCTQQVLIDALSIQLAGRWASDAFRVYTRATQECVLTMSRAMAQARADPALVDTRSGYTQSA